jgi:hypothetical protein
LNKLAVLAFTVLLFLSSMMWYLANGSLNDYLKSQVILQSEYYSDQQATLLSADFSNNTGITSFNDFSLSNIEGLTQPQLFIIDNISAQLAAVPTQQLDSPSIQKKTTTLVDIKEVRFGHLQAWSEEFKTTTSGETNIEIVLKKISTQLAKDYPALYPQISAELYAKLYPERSEKLALEDLNTKKIVQEIEINQAVIASNEAKYKKRLLGKAQTRIIITSVIIEQLTLTIVKNNKTITKHLQNVELGRFGGENGLASNQLGGELLKKILAQLINTEQTKAVKIETNIQKKP